jgi:small conductance mechanosensitive channel
LNTESLEHALKKLYDKLQSWFEGGFEIIPNFVLAVLTLVVAHFVVKFFKRRGERVVGQVSDNLTIGKLIIRFVAISIFVIATFIALGILHLDKTVTSLLAGVGILGLAFSFAFQHTAANILSGLIISIRSTIQEGDLIETNDQFGNVLDVGLRATKILNVKGQHVSIPNRLVMDNPIVEFSQTNFRRIDIVGKINFSEDLTAIRELVEKEMASFDFVYEAKAPNMVFNELDFEKVNFTLWVWMNFTNVDGEYLNARSACIKRLAKLFKEQKIEIRAKELKLQLQ